MTKDEAAAGIAKLPELLKRARDLMGLIAEMESPGTADGRMSKTG
jgi:hypothetical protein